MNRKTSLMEWLNQTKKLSKTVDYIAMDAIDDILDNLWGIDRKVLLKHKKIIDKMCELYHKPNPIKLSSSIKKLKEHHLSRTKETFEECFIKHKIGNYCPTSYESAMRCKVYAKMKRIHSQFVDKSLYRIEKFSQKILWQWFEVIDFMYERPELINPMLIDDYIENCINEVCEDNKKNNPLSNGHRKRFGKYWKGIDGKWYPEKRNRF